MWAALSLDLPQVGPLRPIEVYPPRLVCVRELGIVGRPHAGGQVSGRVVDAGEPVPLLRRGRRRLRELAGIRSDGADLLRGGGACRTDRGDHVALAADAVVDVD